jgi:uncharacterized RmlC-like cupin family protein
VERLLVSDASARRANTGPHHHGRHEVAIYVVKGSFALDNTRYMVVVTLTRDGKVIPLR